MEYWYTILCKNCHKYSPCLDTKLGWRCGDQVLSETGSGLLAIACPCCGHVHLYPEPEHTQTPVVGPGGQPCSSLYPSTSFARLLCDQEGCDTPLPVFLTRPGATAESVRKEAPAWILHDLKCKNGHPIQSVKLE